MKAEFSPGSRVFLADGPVTPGVVLPSDGGIGLHNRLVLLDGETKPVILRPSQLTSATLTPGRRVFRHTGGPHRFGVIPTPGEIPKTMRKARMAAEEESIVVRWDNGEFGVVVKDHLTPVIYELRA